MRKLAHLLLLTAGVAFLAGCREEAETEARETAEVDLFQKGRGVTLPPELRVRLGVETTEVIDRRIAQRTERLAQVFQHADVSAAAVVFLDADEAPRLGVGESVEVFASGRERHEWTGVLRSLETNGPRSLGKIEGVIEIADPERRLAVGSFVTAVFPVGSTNVVPAIPVSAVIDGVAGPFVYVVNGEHFTRTQIKTGASDGEWIAVTDGLYAGDAVVSSAAATLWTIELCALKGGSPCCPVETKRKEKGE